jgi:hypothetical protein
MPFVNNVKYLSVIFDREITWGLHIKRLKPRPSEHLLGQTPYSKVSI